MGVCHYVLLLLSLALLYAGAWTRASGQSPPDSLLKQKEQRIGLGFGITAGSPYSSRFMGGFTRGTQLNMSFDYGQRFGKIEWDIHCRLTRQSLEANRISNNLGLYSLGVPTSAQVGILKANSPYLDGLALSVGGRILVVDPPSSGVAVYMRVFAGIHFFTYQDFSLRVANTNPRLDTTMSIQGESRLLPFVGLQPGIEFGASSVRLSVEFFGFQWYGGYGWRLQVVNIAGHFFF